MQSQQDTVSWESNQISWLFAFLRLTVRVDRINKRGSPPAGVRGC